MRGRGFKPHTEQMLNTGNGLQPLNMERQEPLPAPNQHPISEWILAFHSTHVRVVLAWGLLLSAYIACLLGQHKGRGYHLFIKG